MKIWLFIILQFLCLQLKAEEKLKFKQIFTEIPATTKLTFNESFSKEALPYWGVILGSTALLYHYDEQIYADLQKRGRNWGIGNEDNTKSFITISGQELLRLPTDTGSALYFLGDGWMHAAIGGAFIGAGQYTGNNYNFNTGIMLWHGMMTSTIFNQILKRSFGRESPEVSTHNRGNTKPFPNFSEYNTRTASYDAMPSGHVMTATMTFTIISERYPQYNYYIYPIAGTWVTALMFQMVNNGVLWASDYPLGIAMGYVFGKAATKISKSSNSKNQTDESTSSWNIYPTINGLIATKSF